MPVEKVSEDACKGCPYWESDYVLEEVGEKQTAKDNMIANNICHKRGAGSCPS